MILRLEPCPLCGAQGWVIELVGRGYLARCQDPWCRLAAPCRPIRAFVWPTPAAAVAAWNKGRHRRAVTP